MGSKEVNKSIKQLLKEFKKAHKEASTDKEKESLASVVAAMEKLVAFDGNKEKETIWKAMNRIQLLKEELFFITMLNNLFLSNAITIEQFAEQVSMEDEEAYVKRFREASKGVADILGGVQQNAEPKQ